MADYTVLVVKDHDAFPLPAGDRMVDSAGNPVGGELKATHKTRVATTANIADLSAGAPDTVDGVALSAGDEVLVKNQTTGTENGIYTVDTVGTGANGAWSRSADFDESQEINALVIVGVTEGTDNGDTTWLLGSDGTLTIGTDDLNFVKQTRNQNRVSFEKEFLLDGQNEASNAKISEFMAARAGYLTAHALVMKAARTAGTLSLAPHKNGTQVSASDLDLTIDATDTQYDSANADFGVTGLDVAQGDRFGGLLTTSSFTPLANKGLQMVEVEYTNT